MARPITYDPDEALAAAMRLFWRKGFAETSYDDLTKATGVSRKGLYGSFGDKRGLFLRTLQLYRKTQAVEFLWELDEPQADRRAIQAMFERIGEVSKTSFGLMGCFMANTANDEMVSDPAVKSEVLAHLQRVSQRFQTVLERDGYPKDRAERLADYFTGLLQGLFVLAHAGAKARMIDAHISEGLTVLGR
ncbi:MAG: TetR/AcrR family transcriptional regulator [Pseudomonadota bacterium]